LLIKTIAITYVKTIPQVYTRTPRLLAVATLQQHDENI
jgi:hypothetical protein